MNIYLPYDSSPIMRQICNLKFNLVSNVHLGKCRGKAKAFLKLLLHSKEVQLWNICHHLFSWSRLYGPRVQLGCHAAPDSWSKGTPAAERVIQHKTTLMWRRTNNLGCFNKTAKASKWGGYKHRHATGTYSHYDLWMEAMLFLSWNCLYKSKNRGFVLVRNAKLTKRLSLVITFDNTERTTLILFQPVQKKITVLVHFHGLTFNILHGFHSIIFFVTNEKRILRHKCGDIVCRAVLESS